MSALPEAEETALPGVLVITPRQFLDDRGSFMETFNAVGFESLAGYSGRFDQDNESMSRRDVVRGIHYQLEPFAQGKLVRVASGSVFDVAVDLRRSSETFGSWVGADLSAENRKQLWIPKGFGHAFQATSDTARVVYKSTARFAPDSARSVRWNDPSVGIDWPTRTSDAIVSDKDAAAPLLSDADVFE